jgi:hypothetical protein
VDQVAVSWNVLYGFVNRNTHFSGK